MGPEVARPRLIRFGLFELDLLSGEIRKQGHKVRLEGQPVQVLICLIENPGQLISREELHRKLWSADTFVNFELGLNAAVKRLRQALNDSADNPRFVETLPRRGYRFIAPVQIIAPREEVALHTPAEAEASRTENELPVLSSFAEATPSNALAPEITEPNHWRLNWKLSALILLVLVVISVLVFRQLRGIPSSGIRSLAVLPLQNLSGDTSQEYFSDGMTDALITELGQINALRVISRTSVMNYKSSHESLPQIAHDLNVDGVIEGAVLRSGGRVRITAQLIQARDDKHLWAHSYDVEAGDTLALQKQVARSIAAEIRIQLTPHEQALLNKEVHIAPEAYEAYLKGRYFWNKRTPDGLRMAIDYFNQVIQMSPDYPRAYVGLADSYALLGDWEYGVLAPREAYPKAGAAARKALALDNTLGEAHISLAYCMDSFGWDWDSAGREFRRGIELSPGYATAHQWYAWHLTALGQNDQAIAEMRTARSLDPLSLIISAELAEELLIAHRIDEAIDQSRKAIAMDPFFAVAHFELGQALEQKHMFREAIAELKKAIELSGGSSIFTSNLAHAYARSGNTTEAVRILNELKNSSRPGFSKGPEIALVYVGLQRYDEAMDWLEKAYAERFNPTVVLRPSFDPLRSHSRYQDLMRRIGLTR
jgi:TolB-like protein/DNA-binding winged helix-turn-helix (wHTH) protein/tetratricopeptide (TPR) repeat protein